MIRTNCSLLADYQNQEVYVLYKYSDVNEGLCRIQKEDSSLEVVELSELQNIREYQEPGLDQILEELLSD